MSVLDNLSIGIDTESKGGIISHAFRFISSKTDLIQRQDKILKMLEFIGLENKKTNPAGSLPYGEQRKLEIARALVSSPAIVLLDEPAAGMNPAESNSLTKLIKKIKNEGKTVILIEHHMQVVMGISDRIIVLHHGEKIAEGTPQEIQKNSEVIAAYLGEDKLEL